MATKAKAKAKTQAAAAPTGPMTTVRWKRLKSPARVAAEREAYRQHHLDPDRVSPVKPAFYARVITPEHQGTSRRYTFDRANHHTVVMPDRDADILLYGDDGGEFETVDDETEG